MFCWLAVTLLVFADIGFVGYLRMCFGHWCTLLGAADSFVLSFLPLQIIYTILSAHTQSYVHIYNLMCTYAFLSAHTQSYVHTHNLICTHTQ